MTTPEGKPVNVVYGFVSMVLKLYDHLKPSHMAVAFDRPGPTFRNELFKDYQAHRPETEKDFVSQITLVHDVVSAFGIPAYEKDGFEADDVIGTIAQKIKKKRKKTTNKEQIDQVVIVTGDKDILQLVDGEKVLVFMPVRGISQGKLYGEKDVVERMGVAPKSIVDLKALMGDPSDNYPGVNGIGPKTATRLLKTHGSLDGIYAEVRKDTGDMGEATRSKLAAGEQSALLGKELAKICIDVPITFESKSARLDTLDTPKAREAIEALRFGSLLRRLSREIGMIKKEKRAKRPEKKDSKQEAQQQELF